MATQLQKEIEQVKDKYLFRTYHAKSHLEKRHIGKDIKFLKSRIKEVSGDELAAASAFYGDIDKCLELVYKVLVDNTIQIDAWLKRGIDTSLEVMGDFESPIGYGILKGADWNQPLDMSRLVVLLAMSDMSGRMFKVVTAYPIFNADEVDLAYDAIDSWEG